MCRLLFEDTVELYVADASKTEFLALCQAEPWVSSFQ